MVRSVNTVVSDEKVEAFSLYISIVNTNRGHTNDGYQGCTNRLARLLVLLIETKIGTRLYPYFYIVM